MDKNVSPRTQRKTRVPAIANDGTPTCSTNRPVDPPSKQNRTPKPIHTGRTAKPPRPGGRGSSEPPTDSGAKKDEPAKISAPIISGPKTGLSIKNEEPVDISASSFPESSTVDPVFVNRFSSDDTKSSSSISVGTQPEVIPDSERPSECTESRAPTEMSDITGITAFREAMSRTRSCYSRITSTSRMGPVHIDEGIEPEAEVDDNYYIIQDSGIPLFFRQGSVDDSATTVLSGTLTIVDGMFGKDINFVRGANGVLVYRRDERTSQDSCRLYVGVSLTPYNEEGVLVAIKYLQLQTLSLYPISDSNCSDVYGEPELYGILNMVENDIGPYFEAVKILPMPLALRTKIAKGMSTVMKGYNYVICLLLIDGYHVVCKLVNPKYKNTNIANPEHTHLLQNWSICGKTRSINQAVIYLQDFASKTGGHKAYTVNQGMIAENITFVCITDRLFRHEVQNNEFVIKVDELFRAFSEIGLDDLIREFFTTNNSIPVGVLLQKACFDKRSAGGGHQQKAATATIGGIIGGDSPADTKSAYQRALRHCVMRRRGAYFATVMRQSAEYGAGTGNGGRMTEKTVKRLNRTLFETRLKMRNFDISEMHETIRDLGVFESKISNDIEVFAVFEQSADLSVTQAIINKLFDWISIEADYYLPDPVYCK